MNGVSERRQGEPRGCFARGNGNLLLEERASETENKIALRDFSQIFLAMVMELPKLQKTCSVALKGSIPWVSPTTCTGDASALSPVAAKQQDGPSKAG